MMGHVTSLGHQQHAIGGFVGHVTCGHNAIGWSAADWMWRSEHMLIGCWSSRTTALGGRNNLGEDLAVTMFLADTGEVGTDRGSAGGGWGKGCLRLYMKPGYITIVTTATNTRLLPL